MLASSQKRVCFYLDNLQFSCHSIYFRHVSCEIPLAVQLWLSQVYLRRCGISVHCFRVSRRQESVSQPISRTTCSSVAMLQVSFCPPALYMCTHTHTHSTCKHEQHSAMFISHCKLVTFHGQEIILTAIFISTCHHLIIVIIEASVGGSS